MITAPSNEPDDVVIYLRLTRHACTLQGAAHRCLVHYTAENRRGQVMVLRMNSGRYQADTELREPHVFTTSLHRAISDACHVPRL